MKQICIPYMYRHEVKIILEWTECANHVKVTSPQLELSIIFYGLVSIQSV